MNHPLGCHRPRIPDRVVFEKLVQVLVFSCAYWRIADDKCSATTLRRRRDEWIEARVMDELLEMVLEAYDRFLGLELTDLAVDCCTTKAPCGGEMAGKSPVDRGKGGIKRSMVVDALAASPSESSSPQLTAMTRRSWTTLSTPSNPWENWLTGPAYISTAPTTLIPPARSWQLAG